MSSNKWVLLSSGFVAGLIAGVILMNIFSGPSAGPGVSGSPGAPAPVTPGQAGPDRLKLSRDIAQLEDVVKKDPTNYQAWVQLGNDLFDIGEAQRSVDAYRKALALNGSDPNVWTDMGVMYRQLKNFNEAVASFKKAAAIGPNHSQSRMNLGVVYMHDLNDPQSAIAAWEDLLRVAPNAPNADQIRQSIAELRGRAGGGSDLDKAARELGKQLNQPAAK